MRNMHFGLIFGSVFALLATCASNADARGAPNDLVAQTPNATGIIVAADDGTIRHINSGLECPPNFTDLKLVKLTVSDANTMSCNYAQRSSNGKLTSTLSISVAKAQPDETIEVAFGRYREKFLADYPNAQAPDPGVTFSGGPPGFESAVHNEEYSLEIGGTKLLGTLIVDLKRGWLIEVRSIHPDFADPMQGISAEMMPSVAIGQATAGIGSQISR